MVTNHAAHSIPITIHDVLQFLMAAIPRAVMETALIAFQTEYRYFTVVLFDQIPVPSVTMDNVIDVTENHPAFILHVKLAHSASVDTFPETKFTTMDFGDLDIGIMMHLTMVELLGDRAFFGLFTQFAIIIIRRIGHQDTFF